MSTNEFTIPTDETVAKVVTPHEAFEHIAKHADQLEQLALDLKKAASKISDTDKAEILNTGISSSMVEGNIQQLVSRISNIGKAAHKVHLDNQLPQTDFYSLINIIPNLDKAKRIFVESIEYQATSFEDRIAFKRDINFIEKIANELGSSGKILADHSKSVLDRRAGLLTVDEIEENKSAKFKKGVDLLTESAENAQKYNPAYRERTAKRKPIKLWTEKEAIQTDSPEVPTR